MLEIFSWSIAEEKEGNGSIYPLSMAKEINEYIWDTDTECYSNEEAVWCSSEAPGPWGKSGFAPTPHQFLDILDQ